MPALAAPPQPDRATLDKIALALVEIATTLALITEALAALSDAVGA